MLGAVSFISIACGSAVAYFAERFALRTETLETYAGFMLIGGLFLLGSGLPVLL